MLFLTADELDLCRRAATYYARHMMLPQFGQHSIADHATDLATDWFLRLPADADESRRRKALFGAAKIAVKRSGWRAYAVCGDLGGIGKIADAPETLVPEYSTTPDAEAVATDSLMAMRKRLADLPCQAFKRFRLECTFEAMLGNLPDWQLDANDVRLVRLALADFAEFATA